MIKVSTSQVNDVGIAACLIISAVMVALRADTMGFVLYLWVFMVLTLFMMMSAAIVLVALISVTRLFLPRKKASTAHVILFQTTVFYGMYTLFTALLFVVLESAAGNHGDGPQLCSFFENIYSLECAATNEIFMFLYDQTVKGIFFDFPEVTGFSLTDAQLNKDNSLSVLVATVYRNAVAMGYTPIVFYPIVEFVSRHVSVSTRNTRRR